MDPDQTAPTDPRPGENDWAGFGLDIDNAPVHPDSTIDGALGINVSRGDGDNEWHARVAVDDRHRQPMGIVHGGVYATIAETLASIGTVSAVAADGKVALGISNQTNFMRPISSGEIRSVAVPIHRGRTTWIWTVEARDSQDRLCAITTMTIAVRDAPGR